jgi:hypothetical protein
MQAVLAPEARATARPLRIRVGNNQAVSVVSRNTTALAAASTSEAETTNRAVAGLRNHLQAQIDANDLAGHSHPAGSEQTVQAWLATKFEDGLTGMDFIQAERVAGAAERFRHRGWQGVDFLRVLAELLGAGWAHGEFLLLVGRAGDLGKALRHGGTDDLGGVARDRLLVNRVPRQQSF